MLYGYFMDNKIIVFSFSTYFAFFIYIHFLYPRSEYFVCFTFKKDFKAFLQYSSFRKLKIYCKPFLLKKIQKKILFHFLDHYFSINAKPL